MPHRARLRHAIEWLGHHGAHDAVSLELVAQRFDLSPLEEDYLLREFLCPDQPSAGEGKSEEDSRQNGPS